MIERLRNLPIAAQVAAMIAAGPFVVATVGLAFVPLAARVALDGRPPELSDDVAAAVRLVLAIAIAFGTVAAIAAGALLRSSIRGAIVAMRDATDAIAGGRLGHRVDIARRDELGELAAAINVMAARLESLEAGRRRMIASVSHELRTPLTIIKGHAWTIARDTDDDAVRARLELVEHETERLATLVEELLDAATVTAGGMKLAVAATDVVLLAEEAIERFDVEAMRRGIDVQLTIGAPLDSSGSVIADLDGQRVHQAVGNLLANAIAHAPPRSRVDVLIEAGEAEDLVVIEVRNPGRPIPPAIRESIFEPFVQGPRATGRVGLGLAIVREIATAHRGCVSCDADDRITVFRLELPRRPAARGACEISAVAAAPTPSVARGRGMVSLPIGPIPRGAS